MRFTVRELFGGIVLLPPVAYASGYFLWVGGSLALYGVNLAPHLGIASRIEPGIIYTATVVVALLGASVIGLERLSERPFHATRRISMTRQSLVWFLILLAASALAQAVARGNPLLGIWAVLVRAVYVPIHIALLTAAFRSLLGLIQASTTPPMEERRILTPATRVWQGCLVGLLAILQVYLALLFSVLGPNTAMRVTPIVVELRGRVEEGVPEKVELLLLERGKDRVVGYHPERGEVVEIPTAVVQRIELPRFSRHQQALLAALDSVPAMPAERVRGFFPMRRALRELEVDDLLRSREVERLADGTLRRRR